MAKTEKSFVCRSFLSLLRSLSRSPLLTVSNSEGLYPECVWLVSQVHILEVLMLPLFQVGLIPLLLSIQSENGRELVPYLVELSKLLLLLYVFWIQQ